MAKKEIPNTGYLFFSLLLLYSVGKLGVAVFERLIIDGTLAADEFGARARSQQNCLTDVLLDRKSVV